MASLGRAWIAFTLRPRAFFLGLRVAAAPWTLLLGLVQHFFPPLAGLHKTGAQRVMHCGGWEPHGDQGQVFMRVSKGLVDAATAAPFSPRGSLRGEGGASSCWALSHSSVGSAGGWSPEPISILQVQDAVLLQGLSHSLQNALLCQNRFPLLSFLLESGSKSSLPRWLRAGAQRLDSPGLSRFCRFFCGPGQSSSLPVPSFPSLTESMGQWDCMLLGTPVGMIHICSLPSPWSM